MIEDLGKRAIGKVYPPPGVDKSTRVWVGQKALGEGVRHYYHLETLLDPDYCCSTETWEKALEDDVTLVLNNCQPYSGQHKSFASLTPLPAPLSDAVCNVRMQRNAEAYLLCLLQHLRAIPAGETLDTIREILLGKEEITPLVRILDMIPVVPKVEKSKKRLIEEMQGPRLMEVPQTDDYTVYAEAASARLDWTSERKIMQRFNNSEFSDLAPFTAK
jgi:hypothetical protein